jgi:hypothetical protein
MAVVYDPSIIRSVRSLEEAQTGIQSKDFTAFISAFENMAKLGNQNDSSLIYRHTEVEAGARIFNFGQTLQPFPISDKADNLYGAKIRPKSYALRQKSWMPYEFELGDCDETADEFFATSQQLIQQFELEDYIGLRRYSPDDPEGLEITERKGVSVKIPWDSVMSITNLRLIKTLTVSSPKKRGRRTIRQHSGHSHPGHRRTIGAPAETLGQPRTRITITSIRTSVGF